MFCILISGGASQGLGGLFLGLCLVGCLLGGSVTFLLAGLAGILLNLIRGSLSWKLYDSLRVSAFLVSGGCFCGFLSSRLDQASVCFCIFIASLAVLAVIDLNGRWVKGQFSGLGEDLGEPVRSVAIQRLGRRLWLPVLGIFLVMTCFIFLSSIL